MMERLAHEFLPPVDREDIVSLAQELDNVTDAIDDAMRHLYMFQIAVLRPDAVGLADAIVRCCSTVRTMMEKFTHFKRSKSIGEHILAVSQIESEADELHAAAAVSYTHLDVYKRQA